MRVGTFPLGSRAWAGLCLSIKRHGGILLFVTTGLVKKRAAMPQLLLPGFPIGATTVNETVSVYVEEGHSVWLLGQIEIFRHAQEDHAGFKTIVSRQEPASTKTERAGQDAQAGMGVACTRPQERVAAALGISGAIVRFEPCVDVPLGGVLGRPFFVVSKSVTEGLAATLLNDILPDLLQCVPGQPSEAQLAADPTPHRLVVVFDREGATHDRLSKLWKRRVAAITYRKAVKDLWPESEFKETEVPIPGAGSSTMLLASKPCTLCAGEASIPVIEVRKLGKSGHQTVVMSTALPLVAPVVAGRMFARWCQENFFAYRMPHFDIDGLVQYGAEELPGTVQVVNPAWRVLEQQVRQTRGQLRTLEVQAGRIAIDEGVDIHPRAELHQRMQQVQADLLGLRQTRKGIARKIALSELPEAERPNQRLPLRKALVDTVKRIAYRAETALVGLLRRHRNQPEDGRGRIRELFTASADIQPDPGAETLTIRIHRMACPAHDKAIAALLTELTAAEYKHPQTQAKMIFEMA